MRFQFYSCFVFVLFTFQSCLGGGPNSFENIVGSISYNTGVEIAQQNSDLRFAGIGGALLEGDIIDHETLIFDVLKIIDKKEGVEIISKTVNLYMQNIYSNNRMTAYLEKYPAIPARKI